MKKLAFLFAFSFACLNAVCPLAMAKCSNNQSDSDSSCSKEDGDCTSNFQSCEEKGCDHSWGSTIPTTASSDEPAKPEKPPRKSAAQKSMEAEQQQP